MSSEDVAPMSKEEQMAYDEWLRKKVQSALNDPRPSIPHEEAIERVKRRLDELVVAKSKRESER